MLPLLLLLGPVANAQVRPETNTSAASDVGQVTAFLNDLANGQPEAAYARLTDDFRCYSPAFGPPAGAYELLAEWDARQRRFTAQQFTVEKATSHVVREGAHRGTWVYLEGTWSARDGDHPLRIPFRQWTRLRDGKLAELRLAPVADPLFEAFATALFGRGGNP